MLLQQAKVTQVLLIFFSK